MGKPITVGLFGTCGGSMWRDNFMQVYREKGISFFNPQVNDWKPELAIEEAKHLAADEIMLFPITGETYGTGSLAEVGFSALNAIKLNSERDFVVLIEPKPRPDLEAQNPQLYKESVRARALVLRHLERLNIKSIYMVSTLEEMLRVSLVLHGIAKKRKEIACFSLVKP